MRSSFKRFMGNIRCAEIGVSKGDNAEIMLSIFPEAKMYLIDSYDLNNPTFQFGGIPTLEERGIFIASVKQRFEKYGSRAKLLILDSVEASKRFPDDYFDYVYIDAEHDYKSVLRDITAWYPKVKKGGMIAGHDYGVEGVKNAVEEYFIDGVMSETEDWYTIK